MLNYNYDPQQLFQQTTGLRALGDNPGRPLLRRLQVGQGALALQQQGLRTYLEPQRQSAILRALQNANPANRQAQVDAFSKRAQERAAELGEQAQASLQGLGFGTGAQSGTIASLFGGAANDTANYDAYLNSPQGEMEATNLILALIQSANDPELMNALLAGTSALEQQNNARDAQRGGGMLGNILALAGQAAGGGAFNNLFRRR